MKLKPTTLAAALLSIGLGGFLAGRVSSSGTAATAGERPAATKTPRPGDAESRSGESDRSRGSGTSSRPDRRRSDESSETRLANLEAIVRGEDPLARNRALLDFIDTLGPDDFEGAVARFRELGLTDSRMGEYSLLLTAWGKTDPQAAMAYAENHTDGSFARDTILTSWATNDPEAAIRWAQESFHGEGANPYLPGIIRGIAASDPTRATTLLTGMPRSEERGEGLEFMLPHLLQQGPAATRGWIDAIGDAALKDGAIMRSARDLADTDPAGTVSWLIANPGEGAERRLDDAFGIWARKDPQAAFVSYEKLPAGDLRTDALRGLVRAAAGDDPRSALSLMDRNPADVNDSVVQNFVWHSLGKDPATALTQVTRIGDEGEREQTYRRTLDRWLERDPVSANAWLGSNAVPDSVRARIERRQSENQ